MWSSQGVWTGDTQYHCRGRSHLLREEQESSQHHHVPHPVQMCGCRSSKVGFVCPAVCNPMTGPVAHQAPLSMGFSWQEQWSEFPFLPPGDLPDPGIKPTQGSNPCLLCLLHWQAGSLPQATWEAPELALTWPCVDNHSNTSSPSIPSHPSSPHRNLSYLLANREEYRSEVLVILSQLSIFLPITSCKSFVLSFTFSLYISQFLGFFPPVFSIMQYSCILTNQFSKRDEDNWGRSIVKTLKICQ